MSKSIIEIDGSQGEGGGQVLRTSLALSLITGKPFHLRRIRVGRAKPGLQAQHLMSVQAAAKIGAAKVRGASLGSVNLTFEPGDVTPGEYHFKIGTAGATSLVLHTIYLPLALAGGESSVTIEGGTHVKASPCFHFLARSWARYLKAIGITVEVTLKRVGFYPRGGGMIHARIEVAPRLLAFSGLTTDSICRATIFTLLAGLPAHVGERMVQTATACLHDLGLEVDAQHETWQDGPGCMLGIELPTEPAPTFFFALGERGKPAEAVAKEAVAQVETFLQCQPPGVDEHCADQMLLPLALAEGPSEFRVSAVSSHLLTNAAVIRHFVERSIAFDGDVVKVR
ncbi:MAG: RNA 3'-phosphate cyclase [Gemmataceae bacterium]|nr:RNA 3'-phosphate cyclase [Gemmataceae bacterium]